jgi:ribosomal protein S18 acetylase RimI-like enzyme
VRPLTSDDRGWLIERMQSNWGGPVQARVGSAIDVSRLPGLVAMDGAKVVGVLCYNAEPDRGEIEVALLDAFAQWKGIGTALLRAFDRVADGYRRVWLVTTNDNVDALRFYQRRGWRLAALRPGAVDEAREQLKSGIPEVGRYEIPLRDELVLERTPPSQVR